MRGPKSAVGAARPGSLLSPKLSWLSRRIPHEKSEPENGTLPAKIRSFCFQTTYSHGDGFRLSDLGQDAEVGRLPSISVRPGPLQHARDMLKEVRRL